MARIALTAVYLTPLKESVDAGVAGLAFEAFNEQASHFAGTEARIAFQMRSLSADGPVLWSVTEEIEAEILQHQDADRASRAIMAAAEQFEDVANSVISRSETDISAHELVKSMRNSLRLGKPMETTAQVPLRHDDLASISPDPAAFVDAALKRPFPFTVDLDRYTDGMTAEPRDSDLVISGPSPRAVGLAAATFVRAPRPVVQAKRARPIWAYGTLAILAISFALSWLPLSVGDTVALGAFSVTTTGFAMFFGRRQGVLRRTAVGMVPVLIVVGFALIYSVAGLTGDSLVLGGEALHLVDPLLLSLSLASTVGFLDLSVSGWLRSIAYLEMLLVVGYVSAATLVTLRSLSVRLDQSVRELRVERERN